MCCIDILGIVFVIFCFFHTAGGMDFPGIANMFMDKCLICFNMQCIHFYDDQNFLGHFEG